MAKLQIRKGCFETNSSSMHSIAVTKSGHDDVYTIDEIRGEFGIDGNADTVGVVTNDYGWGFEYLTSFVDKLGYAIASYCGNNYSLSSLVQGEAVFRSTFVPLIKKLVGVECVDVPEEENSFYIYKRSLFKDGYCDWRHCDEVPYDELVWDRNINRYLDFTKSNERIVKRWLFVPDFGSVDHQSVGTLQCFLSESGLSLEDFLIRKDIAVIIDNDNTCYLSKYIKRGKFDEDNIVKMY